MSWLDKAARRRSERPTPRIAKVDLLLAAGETEQALAARTSLKVKPPKVPIALQVLARTQLATGKQADALAPIAASSP